MNNIEELKKAALVATPGPWTSQSGYPRMIVSETEKWTHYDDCGNPEFTGPAWVCNVGDAQNNADFISLANPAAILALIAQLEASRVVVALYDEKLAAAEAELSAAQQRIDELEIYQKEESAANRVLSSALSAANEKHGWIKCRDQMPDPSQQRRVCVFTPNSAADLRYRLVPANLFKAVCSSATHWHYVNDPVEGK